MAMSNFASDYLRQGFGIRHSPTSGNDGQHRALGLLVQLIRPQNGTQGQVLLPECRWRGL